MNNNEEFASLTKEEQSCYIKEFENFHRHYIDNIVWKKRYETKYGIINNADDKVNYKTEYINMTDFLLTLQQRVLMHQGNNSMENIFEIFNYVIINKQLLTRFDNSDLLSDIKFKIYELYRMGNDFIQNKMKLYFYNLFDKEICFDNDIFIYCANKWNTINMLSRPIILKDLDIYLFMLHKNKQ